MTTFIDSIYEFYNNPQNLAAFEEWRKKKHDDTATKSKAQKTNESQKVGA